MLKRRFLKGLENAKKKVSGVVDSAVEVGKNAVDTVKDKADELLDEKDLTFDEAQEQLISDLKKGLRVFDYLDVDNDHVETIKSKISKFAIEELKMIYDDFLQVKKVIN